MTLLNQHQRLQRVAEKKDFRMKYFEFDEEKDWRGCFQCMEVKVKLELVLVFNYTCNEVDYV